MHPGAHVLREREAGLGPDHGRDGRGLRRKKGGAHRGQAGAESRPAQHPRAGGRGRKPALYRSVGREKAHARPDERLGLYAGGGRRGGGALHPVPLRGVHEELRLPRTLQKAPQPAFQGDLQQYADHHGRPPAQQAHEFLLALRAVHRGLPQRLRYGQGLPQGAAEHGLHRQDAARSARVCAAGHAVFQRRGLFEPAAARI